MANQQHSAGYKPVETVEKYKFNTDDIREYLQGRIEDIGAKIRKNPQPDKEVADCQLVLTSHESSKVFYPLIAILPDNVIKSRSRDPEMPDIFSDGDERLDMADNIYGGLYGFLFSKEDKRALLDSASARNALKISTREASWIAKFSSPRIIKIKTDGGVRRYVIMLLDPVRIFQKMVSTSNDTFDRVKGPNFSLDVHAEKMNGRMCKYEVQKSPKRNKRRQDKDIEALVEAAIRGGH